MIRQLGKHNMFTWYIVDKREEMTSEWYFGFYFNLEPKQKNLFWISLQKEERKKNYNIQSSTPLDPIPTHTHLPDPYPQTP